MIRPKQVNIQPDILYYLIASFFSFGCYAFFYNQLISHYPGNQYTPDVSLLAQSVLIGLIATGVRVFWGGRNYFSDILYDFLRTLFLFYILAWGATQIQYTPFHPIDEYLKYFDLFFQIDVGKCVTWLQEHIFLKKYLQYIYGAMAWVIVLATLLAILSRQTPLLIQYYCLMLFSTLVGYSIYYFFPTLAPASVFSNANFELYQQATGLKFKQIHAHLSPTTAEGGLIAFPSFHVIWTWFSVYLTRSFPIVFIVLLAYQICLIFACILLGWHYFSDILASIILIVFTHWFERLIRR